MKWQARKFHRITRLGMVIAALLTLASLLRPNAAKAHCDSVEGPVVAAARAALDAKDVKLVLPYVQAGAEEELTAAFEHTLAVRALGPDAKELADRYFFETTVRLHRAGEGAAYTGLKEGAVTDPALIAADAVLEGDDLEAVYDVLDSAVREGINARYTAVHEAREHAAGEKSVAAERERVEAELGFETYVYAIYTAAAGQAAHAEGETVAAPAHSH
jgi:hypothetical protein